MIVLSRLVCLAVGLASTACADRSDDPPPVMTAELAAEIEGICELPAGALTGQASVPDAMPKIACAVEEARKRNVAIGFISNPAEPNR